MPCTPAQRGGKIVGHRRPVAAEEAHRAFGQRNEPAAQIAEPRGLLRVRSIDLNGFAQPEPRPYPKSGRNEIQYKPIVVMA